MRANASMNVKTAAKNPNAAHQLIPANCDHAQSPIIPIRKPKNIQASDFGFPDFGFWILDFGLGASVGGVPDCTGCTALRLERFPIQNPKSKIQNLKSERADQNRNATKAA